MNAVDPMWGLHWLSGDVTQRIMCSWFSPSYTVNYAGNPAVEDRVITEVASYGRQLGWLTEIVIALAEDTKVPRESLRDLMDAKEKIDAIKNALKVSALDAATEALDRLKGEQPDAYRGLVRERNARLP